MNKTLTIISHTAHYVKADGSIIGLGSTVTEINQLALLFDKIVHVAMLHQVVAPPSALPYTSNKIIFVPLPAVGGTSVLDKLNILINAPRIWSIVHKAVQQTDYFQFRAPTGIGVFLIPYFVFFSTKKGWFKYAGNWKQENAPLSYRFQRWLLKRQKRNVTINGNWQAQPKPCLTFENPCLTDAEVEEGKLIVNQKSLQTNALIFCFVGRLEKEKGVDILIQAFSNLTLEEKVRIKAVHLVGDGKAKQKYQNLTLHSGVPFIFHGFLSRVDVHAIYKISHVIVLPSASEGFPKVIAEALNYGCLPVVSDVSSIGDYIKSGANGFLLDTITKESLGIALHKMFDLKPFEFKEMINWQNNIQNKFTYTYYNHKLRNRILNN